MNSHAAVGFTYPTTKCIHNSIKGTFTISRPLVGWSHETTRVVVHLILTNALRGAAKDCRITLSYGGRTQPFIAAQNGGYRNLDAFVGAVVGASWMRQGCFVLIWRSWAIRCSTYVRVCERGTCAFQGYGTHYPFVEGEVVARDREWGIFGWEGLGGDAERCRGVVSEAAGAENRKTINLGCSDASQFCRVSHSSSCNLR
ncbi:hypothetical protein BJX70DRAFT_360490 [Aspergillus crustosus]